MGGWFQKDGFFGKASFKESTNDHWCQDNEVVLLRSSLKQPPVPRPIQVPHCTGCHSLVVQPWGVGRGGSVRKPSFFKNLEPRWRKRQHYDDIQNLFPGLSLIPTFGATRATTFTSTGVGCSRRGTKNAAATRAKTVSSLRSTTRCSLQLYRWIILAFDGDRRQLRWRCTGLQQAPGVDIWDSRDPTHVVCWGAWNGWMDEWGNAWMNALQSDNFFSGIWKFDDRIKIRAACPKNRWILQWERFETEFLLFFLSSGMHHLKCW